VGRFGSRVESGSRGEGALSKTRTNVVAPNFGGGSKLRKRPNSYLNEERTTQREEKKEAVVVKWEVKLPPPPN